MISGNSRGSRAILRHQPQLRLDCSPAMWPFSHSTVATPRCARNRAVLVPIMPPPMMTTSAWAGNFSSDGTGSTRGAIFTSAKVPAGPGIAGIGRDTVKNPQLKAFFEQKAERCRLGAAQLQQKVRELGGDPERSSSMTGQLHRFWVNIRSAIAGMDEHAILDECERGEDAAKRAYED